MALENLSDFFENCRREEEAFTVDEWRALINDYIDNEEKLEQKLLLTKTALRTCLRVLSGEDMTKDCLIRALEQGKDALAL